jgi:hypothetical protein
MLSSLLQEFSSDTNGKVASKNVEDQIEHGVVQATLSVEAKDFVRDEFSYLLEHASEVGKQERNNL